MIIPITITLVVLIGLFSFIYWDIKQGDKLIRAYGNVLLHNAKKELMDGSIVRSVIMTDSDGRILGRITIGEYTIMDDPQRGGYWIQRTDGEGMVVSKEKLEALIHKFYEETF